ncbi:deoxyribodipyrimidine photo-lyase [Desulfuribacillus alkaliarsenatis]|uniref:deoxyribodipyrimidine photo-lyase n=1 Tax=Desulfuribacillus alkaliarsenatis TaxID=766136 RepID=UPI000AFCD09D|nr:deoxyribodipyrimidine photo-lyase [Desulfuribacillus alkaliarsenatis]
MIQRERIINKVAIDIQKPATGPIIYWMERDQRVEENWAIIYGLEQARKHQVPLIVSCILASANYEQLSTRQQQFMLTGLKELEQQLFNLNIQFILQTGEPITYIPELIKQTQASMLITDFNPLRYRQQWNEKLIQLLDVPIIEVDAHNVIPCWIASNKQEYGAYTIRPKIHRLLSLYLTDFPKLQPNSYGERLQYLNSAMQELDNFINNKLQYYNQRRNAQQQMHNLTYHHTCTLDNYQRSASHGKCCIVMPVKIIKMHS